MNRLKNLFCSEDPESGGYINNLQPQFIKELKYK